MSLLLAVLGLGGCAKPPSDAQLTQQIQSKLSQDSGLQEKTITVQTAGGVVTLSGQVDNDAQRTAAARYAAATPGIKEVVNNLQVGASTPPAPLQTARVTSPAKPKRNVKPQPGVRRRAREASSSGKDKDPSEWDSANNGGNENQTAAQTTPSEGGSAQGTPAAPAPVTPPPPLAPKILTIPSGTAMAIRLVDAVDSESAQQGQTFRATLDAPLSANGEIAIPAGYNVQGHVVEVKSAGKFAGQSVLVLQLDRISAGGKSYSLQTDQYRRQGSSRGKNTAEKVGAGAAIGAIIGGLAGGGKGAGIGAAAGGGIGGGVQAATKGQQIHLASEAVLTFTLQEPLTVTQVNKGPEADRPKLETPQQM